MCIQSIRVVNLLVVSVPFNIGTNWVQKWCLHELGDNEKNCSHLFLFRGWFLIHFCLLFALFFIFFRIVSFVTTTLDRGQFPSQVRPSEINIVVPIRLKTKLYAVFIERSSSINFLFVGQQHIVSYWDFQDFQKLAQKVARQEIWDIFVTKFLLNRPVCFADFIGMILLAVLFLLPLPNCLLKIRLLTLFLQLSSNPSYH